MADGGVMREFLMRLGYKVDPASEAKFKESAKNSAELMDKLGRAATTAGLAVAAGVVKMSNDLNGLFNASRRIGASADNVKAFGYAIKQAGGSAEGAQASLEALAKNFRDLPEWRKAIKDSLGVDTFDSVTGKARDTAEVMLDIGEALRAMPSEQANVWAGNLGIDDLTLIALRSGEVRQWYDEAAESSRKLGINLDESAVKARAFWQELNRLWEDFGKIAMSSAADIAEKLTPAIKWAHEALHKLSEEFDKLDPELKGTIKDATAVGAAFLAVAGILGSAKVVGAVTGLTALLGGLATAATVAAAAVGGGVVGKLIADKTGLTGKFGGTKFVQAPSASGGQYAAHHAQRQKREETAAAIFSNLESRLGLPPGLLDSVWAQESSRGKNMRSPAGAEGHFQFMPGTAKDYGLKNPYDLKESAGAAARMFRDLLNKYDGDLPKALAAYNWGQGNVDRKGMDAAMLIPETRGYVGGVMGRMQPPTQISQVNHITTHGASDPQATGQAVFGALAMSNGNLVRDLKTAVR